MCFYKNCKITVYVQNYLYSRIIFIPDLVLFQEAKHKSKITLARQAKLNNSQIRNTCYTIEINYFKTLIQVIVHVH